MDYMTPAQAAEKWGISRRSVRRYIETGRIPGVVNAGTHILIPADAQKPCDMRMRSNREKQSEIIVNPFVLTSMPYVPGTARQRITEIEDEEKRTIGLAELAYFQGNAELAFSLSRPLRNADNLDVRLGAMLIDVLSALYNPSSASFLANYRDLLTIAAAASRLPQFRKTGEFFSLYLNIMMHNGHDIRFPEVSIDAFTVPPDIKPMSVYAYTRWLLVKGMTGRAIGLSEGALIFMSEIRPVQAVYLCLATAYGYVQSGAWNRAEYYFRYAWSLAEPDGLYAPFAEFRSLLGGLVGQCLRTDYPEAYKKIQEMSGIFFTNWTRYHNSLTGDTVTDRLAPTEFTVATLAARGNSNDDIAHIMRISVNSVRSHLRNIYNKLGIDSRKDLSKYVIL